MYKNIFRYSLPTTFFVLFLASALSILLFSRSAFAASTLNSPFIEGTSWYVCQGYNSFRTHGGADALSLDFTKQLCDGSTQTNTSSAGEPVLAPAAGTVYWYTPAYGALCLNTLDSRSILLVHIDSTLTAGKSMLAGQQVGAIGAAGTRGNAGIAHLHMQAWDKPNCYNGNSIPFDSSHNAQLCGAPDMTITGPDLYNNGTWSGTLFMSSQCQPNNISVYRMYSPVTKHHLFTSDSNEVLTLRKNSSVWNYEGIAFRAKGASGCQAKESVYRFYSELLQTHLYTTDENEKSHIINNFPVNIWRYEGVAYCASTEQTADNKPVYRFYSELLKSHLYTTDENEKTTMIATYPPSVWRYEGVAYFSN